MGRNLYILAATLVGLALLSLVLSFTNIAQQPGSPGDATMWRTTATALFSIAMLVGLGGALTTLFEQAERRHEEEIRSRRAARTRRP